MPPRPSRLPADLAAPPSEAVSEALSAAPSASSVSAAAAASAAPSPRAAAAARPEPPEAPPGLSHLQFGLGGTRVPVVLQTEAAECGLACLAMLLAAHGAHVDLATLRSRHGPLPHGMTLEDFVNIAEHEQLGTRAVQLGMKELPELRLPAMLHWDMGHFVVLVALRGDQCVVHDPAVGERVLGRKALAKHFTGIAVEAWPGSDFAPREEAQTLSIRRLAGRVHGLWGTLWKVLAISLALEGLALLAPLFTQWVVDQVIVARDTQLLATLGIGFALLLGLQNLLGLVRAWVLLRVGTQLRVQWRSNVLAHLMRLPLDYFARRHLGDLVSRLDAVAHIQKVLTGTFVEAALDGLMVVLTLGLMLLYSPLLAAVSAAGVGLYALLRALLYRPLRAASADHLVRAALESSHLLETLRGIRTIRLFARQGERLAGWQSLMVSDVNAELQVQRLDILYQTARRLLSGGFALAVVWLGAHQVMAGALSVGMLLAFIAYREQFANRAMELVNKWYEFKMLGLDAQRLADIVLTPAEAPSSAGRPGRGPQLLRPQAPPRIDLAQLRFRYSPTGPEVLAGLDLSIPAGQSVAIAGASGCGKSTLVQLLLGVYAPTGGTVRVNGVALAPDALEHWRQQIGTVMQDDVLFAGTIAENIGFFDPRLDMDQVQACARLAAVHEDIAALPMGYFTVVGDMGAALSGGQKQRVLLARALYRRPRVLVLDEATSQLDVAREADIGQAIARLPMTRIVVAHRPQTLALVDRVVELRDGRVHIDEPAAAYQRRLRLAAGQPPGRGPEARS